MRTNILKSILFFIVLFLGSCKSELRMPVVTKVTLPLITFDPASEKLVLDGVYDGKFIVNTYYKDLPVDARIVIAMNGDYTNVKIFKSGINVFPSTEPITSADLKTLFGISTIVAGNYFEIGLDVMMQDNKWYPAFNPNGVAYGSGPFNLPGSSPILKIAAVCALNVDAFAGTANITDPDWYGGTYTTTIEKVDATHLKLKNYAELEGDIIITIDPSSRIVTVAKQVYTTNLAIWGMAQYTNPAAEGKGEINACTHKITMTLTNTVDQGSFGTTAITIEY